MNRSRQSVAIGAALVVALIAACAPSGLGPSPSAPSDLAIATGLAPGTFALIDPGSSFGPTATSTPGAKTTSVKPTPAAHKPGSPTSQPTSVPGTDPTSNPTANPTPRPTPKPTAKPIAIPPLSHCQIFPASNAWNERVDKLPVASNSATMIAAIGLNVGLHPDFGSFAGYGIPYNIVGTSTPRSTVTFQYSSESDHVGYPIPAKPKIEAGSDRHLLMVDTNACKLYELYDATLSNGRWHAGSGATWSLNSNALRPAGWTSADAAGLPILPGLARYDEDAAGAILHALRFTASSSCAGYIAPARHEAGSGSCNVEPPMGLRVRLKASVDISHFGAQTRVILQALKDYGMILADNGSPWYISGASDPHWNDDVLHNLNQIKGSDFEVVDTGS
ncbi:MAG TPA: hypothetical protein VGJ17_04850 [Candidatus Limnocylindrales bacterium]